MARAGLSYDDIKRVLAIPSTWGAKISGEQFVERSARESGPKRAAKVKRS